MTTLEQTINIALESQSHYETMRRIKRISKTKIASYIRIGRKNQLQGTWERENQLRTYWNNKVGAWRKC